MNLPGLTEFLIQLKFNNSRAWFDEHRREYGALRQDFVAFMGEVVAGVAVFDPGVADVQARDTLFRINRDVRFANDKSPYKTTFSAAISPGGRHSSLPLYYVQVGADESLVAGGVYFPEAADLRRIRAYTERFPERANALLADPMLHAQFGGLSGEGALKRFPSGFGEASELLKFKSFTVGTSFDLAEVQSGVQDLSAFVTSRCEQMGPLHLWLKDALAFREE